MRRLISDTPLIWLLVCIQGLVALSAFAGGIALVNDGLGMPLSYLSESPFPSYVIPGLILFAIVGGTHASAAILLAMKRKMALFASAVAGFGVAIWIYGEMYTTHQINWMQTLYFGLGITELVLVLGILGIIPGTVKHQRQ